MRERVEPGLAVPLAQRRLHAEVHTIERGVQGRPIELARKADALLPSERGDPFRQEMAVGTAADQGDLRKRPKPLLLQ